MLHLCTNLFLPVMKLKEKVQLGSRKKRACDDPATTYARTLASADVSDTDNEQLRETCRLPEVVFPNTPTNQVQQILLQAVTTP